MSDFTPGPWKAMRITNPGRAAAAYYIYGVTAKGKYGRCVAHVKNSTIQPLAANARLIAAAPELLEACWQALTHIEFEECTHGRPFAAGNVLRKAIAKAEGKKHE